jgi:histidyl-tRNA synthetase
MKNIQSLRGMKDIIDNKSSLFTYFIDNCSTIAKQYGFSFIQTPILEETALFKRSVGQSSDIVSKEMYQFIDKGQNDVCLRPEGTAGVARMFIQEKKDRVSGVFRYFYHGAMFRYERPQKGRLRQFHQFGCESFGEDSVYEDANIILMISQILDFFNIKYTLKLNSLGCKECMPKYKNDLLKYLENLNLCDDCNKRVVTNPIRVLDCKDNNCQKQLTHAPKIIKSLCKTCNDDFTKLQNILNNNNLSYDIDSNLVRGLDYYTKTAFEFISDEIGAKSAIVGGGRYDRLVEFLGGRPTCGIGFAIGIERLLELIVKKDEKNELLYIGAMCENALDVVFGKVIQKRKLSSVITDYKVRSFSKHINNATKKRVTKIALIGENELKNKTIWVKDLDTKIEKNINMEDF